MSFHKAGLALLLVAPLLQVSHVQAADAGTTTLSVGVLHFVPNSSADPLEVTAGGQMQSIPESGSKLHAADTVLAMLGYSITDNVSVEASLGLPPTLHLDATGSLAALGEAGTARLEAPALLLKYNFGGKDSRLRPALALGVAYVRFTSVQLAPAIASGQFLASPVNGTALTGLTTAKLDSSFAPLASAGLSYRIDPHWIASVALSYLPINGKATLTTDSAVGKVTTVEKFKMNSVSGLLLIGYEFY